MKPLLPQLATEYLLRLDIVSAERIEGGYTNKVWLVRTRNGDFIVKDYATRSALQTEARALGLLDELDLPRPDFYIRGGTFLVFRRQGSIAAIADESLAEAAGRWLAALHGASCDRNDDVLSLADSLVFRVGQRAAKSAGYRATRVCLTHGDLAPGNIIVGPDGAFLHPIDFEELAPGDPLVDLSIAVMEFLSEPAADPVGNASALAASYWQGVGDRTLAARWGAQSEMLLSAALEEAARWAELARKPALKPRYDAARLRLPSLLAGIGCIEPAAR